MTFRSVLIVGAGSVGQVFGASAQRAGAKVAFFVREKHVAEVTRGFDLWRISLVHAPVAERLDGTSAITKPAQARDVAPDLVILATPANALREGWLAPLMAAAPNAVVVALFASEAELALVQKAGAAPDRVVGGQIGFIAYAAPLAGETRFAHPGTACWFPPFSPTRFSGATAARDAVVDFLHMGGLPSATTHDVAHGNALTLPVATSYLLGLECEGWNFARFFGGDTSKRAEAAALQGAAAVASSHGVSVPLGVRLAARRGFVEAMLKAGEAIVPLPLETYLGVHFTKVGAQTHLYLRELVAEAKNRRCDVGEIEALLDKRGASVPPLKSN